MESIGITPPVITSAPAFSVPVLQSAPQLPLPLPAPAPATDQAPQQASYNDQAVDQKRVEAVHQAAQQIANIYVVSDQSFSIYKDQTGQYITRFVSLRDGKVTYIPEPTLFKLGGSSGGDTSTPLLKIQA